jgi:hypothetical protein
VSRPTRRSPLRVVAVCLCALLVAGAFGAVLRQSWQTSSAGTETVRAARAGVVYLHPLTGLVGELVEAQSAAVRGAAVDAAGVRTALGAVESQDKEVGALLRTEDRFAYLHTQVENLLARGATGRDAYQAYTDVVRLTVELIRHVGDTSSLSRDPDLDSYYLMDAAIVRLPDAMVLAGRAADLVVLAGDRELAGEDAVRAAVARHGVADSAEEISIGLNKSVEATARATLGQNIAKQFDAFKAAVDAFAPPTMLEELAGAVNAATLAAGARQVFATALPLTHRLLYELDALLSVRQGRYADAWRFTAVDGAAGGVVALLLTWLLLAGRGRPQRDPALAAALAGESEMDDAISSLTDARTLLDGEELMHVGRAVRPRSRERDGAQ